MLKRLNEPKILFVFAGIVALFGMIGFLLQPLWIAVLHFPFAAALAGFGLMLIRQRGAR
jgi:hypothetical protein